MSLPQFSRHFELHQLAGGVFAAIATPDGAAFSNAGMVDLGGYTLVFDTFDNPLAAEDLRQAAQRLTGQPVRTVINSHHHPDHWSGNQVFAGSAEILAAHSARAAMLSIAEHFQSSDQIIAELRERLEQTEAQLRAETDPFKQRALQALVHRQRFNLETLPTLRLYLPGQSFEGRLVFHGAMRRVDVLATGCGHTPGDCILYLPAERIAFLGDLAFFHSAPFMGDCVPQDWLTRIDEVARLSPAVIVPGHGGLGSPADLELEKQYIQELQALVAGVIQSGGSEQDALKVRLPPPFDAWQAENPARSNTNVRRLFRLSAPPV